MEFTNQLKKYVRSLQTNKFRQKYHKFIAEGPKICKEFIISSTYEIEYVLSTEEWYLEHKSSTLASVPKDKIVMLKQKQLEQISTLKSAHKVLIVLSMKHSENTDLLKEWALYLDKIQDPGNMGTLLRIADWYGINKVYLSADCVDVYNPKVVQAGMGAHNRVESIVLVDDLLFSNSVKKYGLVLSGKNINDYKGSEPGLVLIGNESKGLRPELVSALDEQLKIPSIGGAESLNASVACGIACHVLMT